MGHAESVFLVNDDQPEVVEIHVLLQDPVGSYDDVDCSRFGGVHHFRLFLVSPETAQHFHFDGIWS